jgi:hypothetical protein
MVWQRGWRSGSLSVEAGEEIAVRNRSAAGRGRRVGRRIGGSSMMRTEEDG